jgi:hypothetical protein
MWGVAMLHGAWVEISITICYPHLMRERQSSFFPILEEQTPEPARSPQDTLREAIEPYVDTAKLRQLIAQREAVDQALRTGEIPEEISWLMSVLATMLTPPPGEKIRGPQDVAALLIVEMGHLLQEQFRTVMVDTKNRVQGIQTVYQGTLNESPIRAAEVFREPIRRNSAGVIFAHNHPSSDVNPSPEDVLITRELVSAGKILQIDVLDHIIVGRGNWLSMREKGLGFDKP